MEKVLGCNIVFWSPFDLIFLLNLQYGRPYTYMPLTLTQMFQRFRKTFQQESWGGKLRKKINSSEWCFLLAKLLHLKYTTYKGNTRITKVLAGLWKHLHYWQLKSQCSKTKHTNGKLHTKIIYFFRAAGGRYRFILATMSFHFWKIILSVAIIRYSYLKFLFNIQGGRVRAVEVPPTDNNVPWKWPLPRRWRHAHI